MPLLTQRILRGLKPAILNASRPPAVREHPEKIILGVRAGERPSSKPPVRIYLGTERGQFRAERIFIWSVERNRDPSRIYEIFLLRDLKGFTRRFWLTGFTNYRFAIPAFANYSGRAIYNDTDQVYLKDPALLFDTPMDEAGFLSINDRDTSVMLIDCARMREVWGAADVRQLGRKALEARARTAGLWGHLDAGWNARDSEYDPGQSHLVHFTTLHTQPWRPFPDELVYFDNPTDPLWHDMEQEADQARFLPVSARRPSPSWPQAWAALPCSRWHEFLGPESASQTLPELIVNDLLERVPDQDVPWILERLFRFSRQLKLYIREPLMHGSARTRRSLWFWLQQLEGASRLHPETGWELNYNNRPRRSRRFFGGPAADGPIHVLTHRKPGHNNQARAIAARLGELSGRPVIEMPIEFSELTYLLLRLAGRGVPKSIDQVISSGIIVAGGWMPTRIARLLQHRRPALRLVLSGRKAGRPTSSGSIVIQCQHFDLPPHPRRLLTLLPLNNGVTEGASCGARWAEWSQSDGKIALLVGGDSRSHRLDAAAATDMARAVSEFASAQKLRLLVVTGRRSTNILDALQAGLAEHDLLHHWQASDPDNPYALALSRSDTLIVTGESESMLADAASRGRPFVIWPTRPRPPGPWQHLSAVVAAHATRPRINRRGSIKPQQGSTYLCARVLERNLILPPRRIERLHELLRQRGLAVLFGEALPTSSATTPAQLTTTMLEASRLLGIEAAHPRHAARTDLKPHEQRHEHS